MSPKQRRRVLIVDDEHQIITALRLVLKEAGFDVLAAANFQEAIDQAAVHLPDAAIVDLVLPEKSGIEVCRRLREWSDMPIILLSASGDEDRKVAALEAGADDYVTKPFAPRELVARLNAVLRRMPGDGEEGVIVAGELEVDVAARTVRRSGQEVRLTPKEYDLLRVLAQNRGRLMTHGSILMAVWGQAYGDDVKTLRVHVANLRRKIEPDPATPQYIRTDPGVGYRFIG